MRSLRPRPPPAAPAAAPAPPHASPLSRRAALAAALAALAAPRAAKAALTSTLAAPPAAIALALAPDGRAYDAADERLRDAANMLQLALNAETLEAEDAAWTAVIDKYGGLDAPWVPDIVGRAYGNRGNARSRAGAADAALADLNQAIALCPWSVDPVLNRGVVLEQSGRLAEAERDYRAVLDATKGADPSAHNNLGNVLLLQGRYDESEASYARAIGLAGVKFTFAASNRAAVLFQLGRRAECVKEYARLLRRYPSFDDAHAGLAAALWAAGETAKAEGEWSRVEDARYKSVAWLADDRRWPPAMVEAAAALIQLRKVA